MLQPLEPSHRLHDVLPVCGELLSRRISKIHHNLMISFGITGDFPDANDLREWLLRAPPEFTEFIITRLAGSVGYDLWVEGGGVAVP